MEGLMPFNITPSRFTLRVSYRTALSLMLETLRTMLPYEVGSTVNEPPLNILILLAK